VVYWLHPSPVDEQVAHKGMGTAKAEKPNNCASGSYDAGRGVLPVLYTVSDIAIYLPKHPYEILCDVVRHVHDTYL
jgi:hypothetical protein